MLFARRVLATNPVVRQPTIGGRDSPPQTRSSVIVKAHPLPCARSSKPRFQHGWFFLSQSGLGIFFSPVAPEQRVACRYPYLLPNIIGAGLALLALPLVLLFLEKNEQDESIFPT